jgi:Caspase domain
MILRRASLLLAAILSLGACRGDPLPPVSPAPLSACLTFFLDDARSAGDVYDRDVQRKVHASIGAAMRGAGFNVHEDASLPHDLRAELITRPGSRLEAGARIEVALALSNRGHAVDKLEVRAAQEQPDYDGIVADQIVDGLFRSKSLSAFTRELRKPDAKQRLAGSALREALTPACAPAPPAVAGAPSASVTPIATAEPAPASASADITAGLLPGKPDPSAYAFVVGVETYKNAPPAPGGMRDAQRVAALLRRTLGVPDGHIKMAVGEKVDRLAFDLNLEWLKLNVPRGGRIYFYFSGHGALRRQSMTTYLLPHDGDPNALDKTAIPITAFMMSLAEIKGASVIAMVDASFAGTGPRSAPLAEGAPPRTLGDPELPNRVALISAVTSAEAAQASTDGGLFTRYLVEGLGHGRADIDGDGQISMQELLAWAGPRVTRAAKRGKGVQTPTVLLGPGSLPTSQIVLATGLTEP